MVNEFGRTPVVEIARVPEVGERVAKSHKGESAPMRLSESEAKRRQFMNERARTMSQIQLQIHGAREEQSRLRGELEALEKNIASHQAELVGLKKGLFGWFKHREAIQGHVFALAGDVEAVKQMKEKLVTVERYESGMQKHYDNLSKKQAADIAATGLFPQLAEAELAAK